jgi:hypothetical protein
VCTSNKFFGFRNHSLHNFVRDELWQHHYPVTLEYLA